MGKVREFVFYFLLLFCGIFICFSSANEDTGDWKDVNARNIKELTDIKTKLAEMKAHGHPTDDFNMYHQRLAEIRQNYEKRKELAPAPPQTAREASEYLSTELAPAPPQTAREASEYFSTGFMKIFFDNLSKWLNKSVLIICGAVVAAFLLLAVVLIITVKTTMKPNPEDIKSHEHQSGEECSVNKSYSTSASTPASETGSTNEECKINIQKGQSDEESSAGECNTTYTSTLVESHTTYASTLGESHTTYASTPASETGSTNEECKINIQKGQSDEESSGNKSYSTFVLTLASDTGSICEECHLLIPEGENTDTTAKKHGAFSY